MRACIEGLYTVKADGNYCMITFKWDIAVVCIFFSIIRTYPYIFKRPLNLLQGLYIAVSMSSSILFSV